MTRIPSSKIFLTEDLNEILTGLGPNHHYSKKIEAMKVVLKEHMYSGNLIKKKQIPQYYIDKYGVEILYRYQHPEGFRSCYTIGKGPCPYILDIKSHQEYEIIFGYKTS